MPPDPILQLRLYVAGDSARSQRAVASVHRLHDHVPDGRLQVEVVDVLLDPERAEADRVLATPTLVALPPGPARRILGSLDDLDQLVRALLPQAIERAADGADGR